MLFGGEYCNLEREMEVLKPALLRPISLMNLVECLNITLLVFFVAVVGCRGILLWYSSNEHLSRLWFVGPS